MEYTYKIKKRKEYVIQKEIEEYEHFRKVRNDALLEIGKILGVILISIVATVVSAISLREEPPAVMFMAVFLSLQPVIIGGIASLRNLGIHTTAYINATKNR